MKTKEDAIKLITSTIYNNSLRSSIMETMPLAEKVYGELAHRGFITTQHELGEMAKVATGALVRENELRTHLARLIKNVYWWAGRPSKDGSKNLRSVAFGIEDELDLTELIELLPQPVDCPLVAALKEQDEPQT